MLRIGDILLCLLLGFHAEVWYPRNIMCVGTIHFILSTSTIGNDIDNLALTFKYNLLGVKSNTPGRFSALLDAMLLLSTSFSCVFEGESHWGRRRFHSGAFVFVSYSIRCEERILR